MKIMRVILCMVLLLGTFSTNLNAEPECQSARTRSITVCKVFTECDPLVCVNWDDDTCNISAEAICWWGGQEFGYQTNTPCPGTFQYCDCYRQYVVACYKATIYVFTCASIAGSYDKWNSCN